LENLHQKTNRKDFYREMAVNECNPKFKNGARAKINQAINPITSIFIIFVA